MNTDQLLNIALGAGLAPLILGFFASLIPEVREKMMDARQFVSLAVACCTLIFSVVVFAAFPTFFDVITTTVLTIGIVLVWLQRLGYWRKKLLGSYRMAEPVKKSFFDFLFGANRNARVVWWGAFIVVGIPLMAYLGIPNWMVASSPAWFWGLSWALEEIRIF